MCRHCIGGLEPGIPEVPNTTRGWVAGGVQTMRAQAFRELAGGRARVRRHVMERTGCRYPPSFSSRETTTSRRAAAAVGPASRENNSGFSGAARGGQERDRAAERLHQRCPKQDGLGGVPAMYAGKTTANATLPRPLAPSIQFLIDTAPPGWKEGYHTLTRALTSAKCRRSFARAGPFRPPSRPP